MIKELLFLTAYLSFADLDRGFSFISFHLDSFRHFSYISNLAEGVICGFGSQGYEFALRAATRLLYHYKILGVYSRDRICQAGVLIEKVPNT